MGRGRRSVIHRHVNPHFLSEFSSYDVAGNIYQGSPSRVHARRRDDFPQALDAQQRDGAARPRAGVAVEEVVPTRRGVGSGRRCSPCHRMQLSSRSEGLKLNERGGRHEWIHWYTMSKQTLLATS